MSSTISVVGLGKLGAPIAAAIASRGLGVIGVDVDRRVIDLIKCGQSPVKEPGLSELIQGNRERLTATSDYGKAVLASDITFITVPTPSGGRGGFSLRHVAQAAREIGRALRQKSGYHVVGLTSTVLPGATQFGVLPILEQESGKECGRDFGLCYSPEFVALGTVIRDFLSPDFVLVGESDERAGAKLEAFYDEVCLNSPRVARMDLVNAELTKIAVNTFVTTKITFANTLAELCEQLPGASVDVVTGALGLDSRIGTRYLKGGLGYGGPCFPRDNLALSFLARQVGRRAMLAECTDEANRGQGDRIAELVRAHSKPYASIAVLGLSYKPDSDVVEESQGLYLAQQLSEQGYRVTAFDPLAMENARRVLQDRVIYADSPETCVEGADTVVIANPDRAFASLEAENFRAGSEQVVVVDCWRILRERLEGADHVRYVGLGIGTWERDRAERLATVWRDEIAEVLQA